MSVSTPGLRAAWSKVLARLRMLPRALRLAWDAAPGWTLLWIAGLVIQGLLPVGVIYMVRDVVEALAAAMETADGSGLRPLFVRLAGLAALLLASELLRSWTAWIRAAQGEHVLDHVREQIHASAARVDLDAFEAPEYYDRLHRASVDAASRPALLFENLGSVLQSGITLVAMVVVLAQFGVWAPAALLVGTLPALAVVVRATWRYHAWRIANTGAERRSRYYDWVLTTRESAAEIRLFALARHMRERFVAVRRRLRKERLALARDQAVAEGSAAILGLAVLAVAVGGMAWRAAHGAMSLGELTLFAQAFFQGQRLLRTVLHSLGQILTNVFFLENLFEFLALDSRLATPPEPRSVPSPLAGTIVFDDVSYRYPGSHRPALEGLSLEVPGGTVAAFVGPNGAGKSTLIRLLCRFHDPSSGRVTLDGVDLRDFDVESLRRQITVLFQEPFHYQATVAENVGYGDLTSSGGRADVEAAVRAAGAQEIVARLPDGYETLLGRWFGGAELSVGEWQRLALARAFLRRSPVVVLDEPTSAMDSWAEADWLQRLRAVTAGRTTIIVTHRFTTAMQADVIFVLSEGRLIEQGSHEALVEAGGLYARSWHMQRPAGRTDRSDPIWRPASSGASLSREKS